LHEALTLGLENNPLIGNGPRADLEALSSAELKITEVHNDYLSIRYNYGWVGLIFLLFGFVSNFFQMYVKNTKLKFGRIAFFGNATLTLFLGFFLFMYSDNILKYTVFFPNLFFALVGIYYSLYFGQKQMNLQNG
jgi:O-antigen ligase